MPSSPFYGFLVKSGILAHNPFDGIGTPKLDRKIPQILTENEMQEFLDALPEENFLQLRNKALFEFLYATGLRISELTGLRAGDIHFAERLVRVMGKGKKERIVPFHEQAAEVMVALPAAPAQRASSWRERVFVNARGGALSQRSVERILQQVYRQLSALATGTSIPTCCAIRSPPTCCNGGRTCGSSRSCWGTPTWPPPKNTPP